MRKASIAWMAAALILAATFRSMSLPVIASTDLDEIYLPIIVNDPTATPSPTPTATPIPTATATATATPVPTATPGFTAICSYNAYNCRDFSTQRQAQQVFEYCMDVVGYDVHWLDGDNDGIACEALP